MKILKLVLSGYRRFDLLGVNQISYTPESPYQLILGGNGIGKSSLLNELSPLPCESEDLKTDGYKLVEIEHRGSTYLIRYDLHKKLDCSFIKDGVELNEGNTIKVQKDLILEHFNYDNNIHDLLIGFTKLTTMAPQQRREWFVKMSRSDMSYAIGLYNKLRSADRDIKGALKLNNQRIVNEQTKLPSSEDIVRIRLENETLKQELNHLLPFFERDMMNQSGELMRLLDEIENDAMQLLDAQFNLKFEGCNNIVILNQLLSQYKHEEQTLTEELKKTVQELSELQDWYNKHKALSETPLSVINNEIFQVQQALQDNNRQMQRFHFELGNDVVEQIDHYRVIAKALRDCLLELPINLKDETTGEYRYTRNKYQACEQQIQVKHQKLIETNNRLGYLKRELTNLNNVHEVDCPNCKTSFKPGVDCHRLETLKKQIEQDEQVVKQLESELNVLRTQRTEMDSWINGIRRFKELQTEYYQYRPLFNYLLGLNLLNDNPKGLINHLKEYYDALLLRETYFSLTKQLTDLEATLARRLAAEGQDVEYIVTKMAKLEEMTTELKMKQQQHRQRVTELTRVIVDYDILSQGYERLTSKVNLLQQKTLSQIRYENQCKLEQLVSEKQVQLANNENFVNRLSQSEAVIQQLQQTNQSMEEEKKGLQLLIGLLSPQDGLIAESLIGFLNQFLTEMGNVLDQIWTYPMRPYLELGEEGIELDYRFKVDINEGASTTKDVSKLSTGQKDVVDFVFKLLLMQHLDLQDYPLFMDEVGGTFEAIHRDRLYRYVKLLVESNQVQQVFIISHISSSHDALSAADRNVLDTDATMIDAEVNKAIEFS